MPEDILVELFADPFYEEYFLTRKMLEYGIDTSERCKELEQNNSRYVDEGYHRRYAGFIQAVYESFVLEYGIDKDDACYFLFPENVADYDPAEYLTQMKEITRELLPGR